MLTVLGEKDTPISIFPEPPDKLSHSLFGFKLLKSGVNLIPPKKISLPMPSASPPRFGRSVRR